VRSEEKTRSVRNSPVNTKVREEKGGDSAQVDITLQGLKVMEETRVEQVFPCSAQRGHM